MAYPKEFLWGVSTAAVQVEGGAAEDGRSPSIWDAFAAEKKVMNAKYFPTACDSYHRFFSRDLANLKALGVNSYRMSLSWSRVLPEGTGKLNEKGVDYYKRAFEALLEEGITPNVTLYHWDLPQVLEDRGGWANRDCIEWFGEYAEKMFRLYSDLVPYFATVNEPIATYIGYAKGKFAPGHRDETLGNRARHNLLVAHGRAVEAFRAVASKSAKIGIVIDVWKRYAKYPTEENLAAVRDEDERNWKFYTDPVLGGAYSDYILSALAREGTLMEIKEGDLALIHTPIDFFGLPYQPRREPCDAAQQEDDGQGICGLCHLAGARRHRGCRHRGAAFWELQEPRRKRGTGSRHRAVRRRRFPCHRSRRRDRFNVRLRACHPRRHVEDG